MQECSGNEERLGKVNELGTQLVDEGHPSANEIQKTTENVNSRLVLFQILFGSFFFQSKKRKFTKTALYFVDGLSYRMVWMQERRNLMTRYDSRSSMLKQLRQK